jgi:lysophospholipase L1-like esterase
VKAPDRSHRVSAWVILVIALAFLAIRSSLAAPSLVEAKRVVFVGDSITYAGEYIEFIETWLRLQHPESTVEILNLGLPSETVSGLSEPGHAGGAFPRPDLHERLGRILEKTKPDLVVACYGMNDGIYYPYSQERMAKFQDGMKRLRERVAATGAAMLHLTPPVFDPVPLAGHTLPAGREEYRSPYEGYNDVLDRFSEWLVSQRAQGWTVIDIHEPLNLFLVERRRSNPKFVLAGDGVHANTQGHWLIAREILRELGAPNALIDSDSPARLLSSHPRGADLLGVVQRRQRLMKDSWLTETRHTRPGMGAGRPLVEAQHTAEAWGEEMRRVRATHFPGERSSWNGFDRFDFELAGHQALVVAPRRELPGRPWIWHGEFFGHKPLPDMAMLGRGFHVVYLSVPDQLGGPAAVKAWNQFYRELTDRFGFGPRPALVGLSRGGLYCYNWAIANPTRVSCIYGDAPVCDFKSWPGGKGKGPGSAHDWQLVLERYGFKSESEALAFRGNPIDNLAPLASAKVPLLHVFGDADEVVPWEENTGLLAERYQQLGGSITLIRKPGIKHHPHGLEDSTPIIDFLWKHGRGGGSPADLADSGPKDFNDRPLIRKLGTLDLDLVETTPVVFHNQLWRFEWVRDGYWNNARKTNFFRFIDPATGESTAPFADGHEFGSAFVHDGTMYVTGTAGRDRIQMFASHDLKTWDSWPVLAPGRYGVFNTSVCRAAGDFVLMFEIDRPTEEAGAAFTARFLRSKDLRTWTLTSPDCNYAKDRYTAPHALRWHDGWFFDFYLEAHRGYELRVVRSRDLVHWEPSPFNPVLRASPEDKIISNTKLSASQRQRISEAVDLNNSDIDFCEWQGRLSITYSWGNQQGVEHLAEAAYDGSLAQFLNSWFPVAR